jgi:hypothetical protein
VNLVVSNVKFMLLSYINFFCVFTLMIIWLQTYWWAEEVLMVYVGVHKILARFISFWMNLCFNCIEINSILYVLPCSICPWTCHSSLICYHFKLLNTSRPLGKTILYVISFPTFLGRHQTLKVKSNNCASCLLSGQRELLSSLLV